MNNKKKKWIRVILISLVIVAIGFVVLGIYKKHQLNMMIDFSFDEAIEYTTQNNDEAVITVGIIKNGEISTKVYNSPSNKADSFNRLYEIGSMTKTFTASLINKAIQENRLNLDDSINMILDVGIDDTYPTIRQLLTHTAGYKAYYFEPVMIRNYFSNNNDFYGITKEKVLAEIKANPLNGEEYSFNYSNFGYSVLGLVLEEVYQRNYIELMNDYISNELGLRNTKVAVQQSDVENAWIWNKSDAYIPAGAITSDISDMLSYAQMQIDGTNGFENMHKSLATIDITNEDYQKLGIQMDAIGMSWIIDKEHNIIWHNGATQSYNSYIGFNIDTQTAIVILSNLSPGKNVSATILGAKLFESLEPLK